jgi:hypothetical protein
VVFIRRIGAYFKALDEYLSVTISRRLRAALLLSAAATILWLWSAPIIEVAHGPYHYGVRYDQASLDSEYERCVSLGSEEYHKNWPFGNAIVPTDESTCQKANADQENAFRLRLWFFHVFDVLREPFPRTFIMLSIFTVIWILIPIADLAIDKSRNK